MEIGIKLKQLRVKQNYKQYQVADCLKISESFYGKIERNMARIDSDKLKLLADFYQIPVSILFDENKNLFQANKRNEILILNEHISYLKEQIVNKDQQIYHLQGLVEFFKCNAKK